MFISSYSTSNETGWFSGSALTSRCRRTSIRCDGEQCFSIPVLSSDEKPSVNRSCYGTGAVELICYFPNGNKWLCASHFSTFRAWCSLHELIILDSILGEKNQLRIYPTSSTSSRNTVNGLLLSDWRVIIVIFVQSENVYFNLSMPILMNDVDRVKTKSTRGKWKSVVNTWNIVAISIKKTRFHIDFSLANCQLPAIDAHTVFVSIN